MFLLKLLAFITLPLLVVYLAIAPLLHAQFQGARRKTRYFLIDFFGLMIVLQVLLAMLMATASRPRQHHELVTALPVVWWMLLLWWTGVDCLSQLGIRQTSRRLTMHVAAMPGAMVLLISSAGLGVGLIDLLRAGPAHYVVHQQVLVSGVITLTGVFTLRATSLWLLRGREISAIEKQSLKTTSPALPHRVGDETANDPAAAVGDRAPASSQTTETLA